MKIQEMASNVAITQKNEKQYVSINHTSRYTRDSRDIFK